jgi:UDP-N-acetylglucosamine:LPS N-acetylglucosamine transferase
MAMHGIVERMGIMVDWFRDAWPCLLVVDVSVEVALLARLCSVPTVYIRQRGNRSDAPHALAYASAATLLAPYPEAFSDRPVLDEWADKTVFSGFISRYTVAHDKADALKTADVDRKSIIVLIGHGGTAITARDLSEAARACPQWHWTVLGPIDQAEGLLFPANIDMLGVVDDPAQWIATAHVVVGSAGDSVVAEIAAFRQRFICFAEPRPFDEQMATAQSLERHGLAVYCRRWPNAALWPVILGRAMGLDPAQWDRFADTQGAQRAATAIMNTAESAWRHVGLSGAQC